MGDWKAWSNSVRESLTPPSLPLHTMAEVDADEMLMTILTRTFTFEAAITAAVAATFRPRFPKCTRAS